MAKLLSTIIDGFVKSKDFVSGAFGSGWRIARTLGRWVFETDDIVVRGQMTVFELLIQKIRAVKGALGITQASGKIREIREDDTNYYIQVEDEMSFVANDIVKCQTFSGEQKNYWVIVSNVVNNEIVIPKSEFVNSSLPEVGDEMIQFGNTTDETRQSAIYLHADEGGQPAIDVLFGINSKSFDGKTKIRVGGDIPGSDGYKGFYCENGMIKSVNTKGETMYMLRPDGSGVMAKGNISWDADGNGSIFNRSIYWDKDGFHFGSGIKLTWDNLSADAKEALKGDKGDPGDKGNPGKDANLLPWVEDWNNNKTEIEGEHVISPKIFSGTRGAGGKLTGVAFGRDMIEIDGVVKTGVFGVKDGNVTFSIDAETGDAFYGGTVLVEKDPNNFVKIYHDGPGDWGMKGVSKGESIFRLGSENKVGPFSVEKDKIYFQNKEISMDILVSMILGGETGFDLDVSWIEQPGLPLNEKTAMHVKLKTSRNGQAILAEAEAYKDSSYNYAIRTIGSVRVDDGYLLGVCVPSSYPVSPVADRTLSLQETLVAFSHTSKVNIQLPQKARDGHTVIFHAGTGRKADMGIICSNDAKINYRGTAYNWINVSNTRLTIIVRKIGGYWFATHEEEWTTGFGN